MLLAVSLIAGPLMASAMAGCDRAPAAAALMDDAAPCHGAAVPGDNSGPAGNHHQTQGCCPGMALCAACVASVLPEGVAIQLPGMAAAGLVAGVDQPEHGLSPPPLPEVPRT